MREVAGDREELLKGLGELTGEASKSRKSKAGRVALGQPLEEGTLHSTPTATRSASSTPRTAALRSRLDSIEGDYQKLLERRWAASPATTNASPRSRTRREKARPQSGLPRERPSVSSSSPEAEKNITETMRRNPDHPVVKHWQQRLDEADAIRAELSAAATSAVGLEKGREDARRRSCSRRTERGPHPRRRTKRTEERRQLRPRRRAGHDRPPERRRLGHARLLRLAPREGPPPRRHHDARRRVVARGRQVRGPEAHPRARPAGHDAGAGPPATTSPSASTTSSRPSGCRSR
jgi:hypothetical protein